MLSGFAPYAVALSFDVVVNSFAKEPQINRCWRSNVADPGLEFIGFRRCFALGPDQVFEGILLSEFEGSHFLDKQRPANKYARSNTLLVVDDKSVTAGNQLRFRKGGPSRVWHLRFIGAEPRLDGPFRHPEAPSDGWIHERTIVLHRVLHARLVRQVDAISVDEIVQSEAVGQLR